MTSRCVKAGEIGSCPITTQQQQQQYYDTGGEHIEWEREVAGERTTAMSSREVEFDCFGSRVAALVNDAHTIVSVKLV